MNAQVKKPRIRATAFGNPHRVLSPRFYEVAGRWLAKFNKGLYIVVVALFALGALQLVYLAFGPKLADLYVSDGTIFSCPIDGHASPVRSR